MISAEEIKTYKHVTREKVKFHEVDMMHVCNNAVYFNYFEDARVKYVQDLKIQFGLKQILENGSFFIMVNNNCDYFQPAHFDDELLILTKIDFIKNTSFGFKHIVVKEKRNVVIAAGGGVVVHIDLKTKQKKSLPAEFYDAVTEYEESISIIK
ncbi:MAG: acyl-CoA thioesterase [Melioribacteraceae bacterium]|nr:acyl-CoA thioesterase [Melioribacteraceae bacterium]